MKTDKLINKCKCGRKVVLRRCMWFDEGEDIREAISFRALTGKHKQRIFFFRICKCGEIYFTEPSTSEKK